jgi:alkylation response protein AidB-like acyl-CoA dehydrogenase
MRFDLPRQAEAFRAEVKEFVAEHVTDQVVRRAYETGTMHDWRLHRALAEKRWLAAPWPEAEGGQGRSPFEMMVLLDELHRAGAPLDGWITTMCGASAIRATGNDRHREEVVKAVVAGEALIALGFSEPDAGSDVAAARTVAERDGDEWVINGQKMFTTMAHEARWVFLLARTDRLAAKHRGLTMFLVPMDSPGVAVDPVHTLGGERTNVTFYTDVRIPDANRVGGVNEGWQILTLALTTERGSAFGAGSSFLGTMHTVLERTAEWARTTRRAGAPVSDDPHVRRRMARAYVEFEVSRLLNHRSIWLVDRGEVPDVEASIAKLFATESLQRVCSDLLDLLGTDGLRNHLDPDAPGEGEIEHAYRHGAVTTIYGGSSEIMRNIIAARGLGLPRS